VINWTNDQSSVICLFQLKDRFSHVCPFLLNGSQGQDYCVEHETIVPHSSDSWIKNGKWRQFSQ